MKTEPILVGVSQFFYSKTDCDKIATLLRINGNKISLVFGCIKDQWKPEDAEGVIRLIEAIKENPDYWNVVSQSKDTLIKKKL